VAEIDGRVVGYCYYCTYRIKVAYDRTLETTIYVCPTAQGCGVGSALYQRLIEAARENGIHSLIACVGPDNLGSVKLHEKFGFRLVGYLKEVGWKFNAWQDRSYYHLLL
jgi:phosphinothricin acetyltransferase